jgi:hypothetical protein
LKPAFRNYLSVPSAKTEVDLRWFETGVSELPIGPIGKDRGGLKPAFRNYLSVPSSKAKIGEVV